MSRSVLATRLLPSLSTKLIPAVAVALVLALSWAGAGRVGINSINAALCGGGYGYGYGQKPAVDAISPASGPTTGGTVVTLTGCGFTGATAVDFGSTAGTGVTVVSDSQITVHSPAASAGGFVYVTVTTSAGTSPKDSASNGFNYTEKATWCATYDLSGVPATWQQGIAATFSVRVFNCGIATWTNTGYNEVDLDMHFASSQGGSANESAWLTSLALPASAPVAPGGSASISFTITPNFFGHEYMEALMIVEHAFWFDQATLTPTQFGDPFVYVAPDIWNASINTSTFPSTWIQGVSQTFNVTVTNNGNVTWPSTGFTEVDLDLHFASSPGGSANQSNWITSNAFSLPADVAPGGSAIVSVTLTPNFFGHEYLEALMVKEHQFWFDHVTSSPQQWADPFVLVSPAVFSATIDTSTFPTVWVKGVSQTFLVTVHNTGNVTWVHNGTNPVELDMHFASFSGGSAEEAFWLTSNIFALAGDVAPGGSATVSVTLTPNFFGHEVLEGEMFKNQQFWFDNTAKSNATNPQWYFVNVLVSAT
jgi:IPT/TIG domain-containing protein